MIDDVDDIMAEYTRSRDPDRNRLDRHRDFRKVFLGSEEGKRVLADIMFWGNIWRSSVYVRNPYVTHAREGARYLVLEILAAISVNPADAPLSQGKDG